MATSTSDNHLDRKALEAKAKRIGIVILAILVPLFLVDVTILKGKIVFRKSGLRFAHAEEGKFEFKVALERTGEKHTVRLDSGDHNVALSWSLTGPDGSEVLGDTEYLRHTGGRRSSFTLETAGEYTLSVGREQKSKMLSARDRDSVAVEILVGDRRIIGPVFEWFKF